MAEEAETAAAGSETPDGEASAAETGGIPAPVQGVCVFAVFVGTFLFSHFYMDGFTGGYSTVHSRSLTSANVPVIKRSLLPPFLEFGLFRPILENIETAPPQKNLPSSQALIFSNGWTANPHRFFHSVPEGIYTLAVYAAFLFLVSGGVRWLVRQLFGKDLFAAPVPDAPTKNAPGLTAGHVIQLMLAGAVYLSIMPVLSSLTSGVYGRGDPALTEAAAAGATEWNRSRIIRYSDGTVSTADANRMGGRHFFLFLGVFAAWWLAGFTAQAFPADSRPAVLFSRLKAAALALQRWHLRDDNGGQKLAAAGAVLGLLTARHTILDVWDAAYRFLFAAADRGWHAAWQGGVRLTENSGGELTFSDGHRALAETWTQGVPVLAGLAALSLGIVLTHTAAACLFLAAVRRILPCVLRRYILPQAAVYRRGAEWDEGHVFRLIRGAVCIFLALALTKLLTGWLVHPLLEFGPAGVYDRVSVIAYENDVLYFSNGTAAKEKSWWKRPAVPLCQLLLFAGIFSLLRRTAERLAREGPPRASSGPPEP